MDLASKSWPSLLLASVLTLTFAGLGCGGHHAYRIYDQYYTDYHQWDDAEVVYYKQWCVETRRDSQRDFRKLRPEEEKDYWTWRHNHEHDHR